ncbi:MAG: bifunctional diaminohydroxyphosphoribosylaminopyrimidine deaminase/5-amino-6-(5-phosphoribosylamino)uracil reductase RibD [Gemmatimonadales bacterium]
MNEREAMERALELALAGWGRVAPNPMVGAVLLRDGKVIGEGYHAEFGGPHAEVQALSDCADPRGATCVVNLEPCRHTGKTPPCADALVEAGIEKLIYAVEDPDVKAGGGAERLREAGIQVERGLLSAEAAALNAPFLCTRSERGRPFVAIKVATSLDGFLADASERSQWISGPGARAYVQWLRAGFDAIAVGRRTAEADNPQLTAREVVPRIPPTRVVFSHSGAVPPTLQIVETASSIPTFVVTTIEGRERARSVLGDSGVRFVAANDLDGALHGLWAAGIRSMLVEGGGELVGSLMAAGVVDRVYWIQAPLWLGKGRSAFGDRPSTLLTDAERWTVVERRPLGKDTLLVVDRAPCLPES